MLQLTQYCLEKKGAVEDFPFGPEVHVIKVGGKMFALLATGENGLQISLKCEPELAETLRLQYEAIKPGYHLNKRHWNTIQVEAGMPEGELLSLIDLSYDLVFKGLPKSAKQQIIL
ncbi:MmcQ/YjbR family DNA-binding protein [Brevibacillus borstelensis]|uniref:MmcQ/YjbR family DNA-binding protein n=1 Tax=Brevibacillus borstelensis TaxID=45462 RepID=UPI0030BD1D93